MLSVAPDRPVDPLAIAILRQVDPVAPARELIGRFQVGLQED
jgi:hypothetical protein